MRRCTSIFAILLTISLFLSIMVQGGMIHRYDGAEDTDEIISVLSGPTYYNRTASRGYAYRWWNSTNPHYNDFSSSGGDCANFVSQCLIAGGLSLHNGTDGNGYGVYPDVDRPSTFSNGTIPYCDYLHTHLVNYQPTDYQQITSNDSIPSWMGVGDVVIFGSTNDNWEHAMTVVWEGTDDLGLAGHSSNKWNYSFNTELSYFDLANMYHIQSHGYQGEEFLFEVNVSTINVRVGPGIKDTGNYYQDIGDVHSGQRYIAIETALDDSGNTWYKFWFDDRSAWLAAHFSGNEYAVPCTRQTYLEIDVSYYLNVRTGPGTSYTDIGEVYSGMRFYPIDNTSGWYKYYWSGQEVWSSGSYMDLYSDRVDGIDVSHWQGDIDWNQVYSAGYRFAFCKATGGVSVVDGEFEDNMINGTSAGVLMGAYHFAHPEDNNATDEVDHFLSVAGDYITDGYLRPVLDLESGDGELNWTELSGWADTWMKEVKNRTGVEPLIYTGWYRDYLDPYLSNYDLWVAYWTYDPTGEPETGIWSDWAFWQYSDNGSVPGISGPVDLDLYNGNISRLKANFVINISGISRFDISLSVGWNFVSTNLVPKNDSIGSILNDQSNGIGGSYDRVMYYESSVGKWRSYMPNRSSHYDDLTTWDEEMGIWIKMKKNDNLTIEGYRPSSISITLHPGWNMVGYPNNVSEPADSVLPSEVYKIGLFDDNKQYDLRYDVPSNVTLKPGEGYWLYNSAHSDIEWAL